MKICPNCSGQIPDQAKFCNLCGKAVPEVKPAENRCPKCGTVSAAGVKFCGKCGSALGASELKAVPSAPKVAEVPKTPVNPVPQPKVKKQKEPKKGAEKVFRFFKWALVVLTSLVLIGGLGFSLYLGCNGFKPSGSGSDTVSVTTDDGMISVSVEYVPDAFKGDYDKEAELHLVVKNLTMDTMEDLELGFALPAGLESEEDGSLVCDVLGPGSTRSFTIPVKRIDPLSKNMLLIILIMVATAAVSVFFIYLFAKACRKQYASVSRVAATVLAFALFIPMLTAAVYSAEAEVGKAELVYEEGSDVARELSVEVKSRGDVSFGRGGGKLTFDAKYSLNQRLYMKIVPNMEESVLEISWDAVKGAAEYVLYKAGSSLDFSEIETTDNTSVTVSMPGGDISYYRIAARLEDGELYSGDSRVMVRGESFSSDADCDLLPDSFEEAFGTSPTLSDTDGDGLSDYIEVTVTFTDPLVYDSVIPGTSDGDVDLDNDGLSSAHELELGTNPTSADSDFDGALDGDEVNTLRSDPLLRDTDGDGLTDGDEAFMGADPTSPDTDGDGVLDPESVFSVDLTASGADGTKVSVTDKGAYLPEADATDITESTTIKDLEYIASPVITVTVPESSVGSVTLPITGGVDSEGGSGEINVVVFDKDDGSFHIVEGGVVSEDGKTISAPLPVEGFTEEETVTSNGETTVVRRMVCTAFYVANWHDSFDAPLSPGRDGKLAFDVEFVIDESGSMEDDSKSAANDPNRYRVLAAKNFAMGLLEGDRAAVVGFSSSSNRKTELSADMVEVCAAIDSISGHNGGTALYTGIDEALNELIEAADDERGRFIIALTDGEDNDDNTEHYDRIIATCVENEIPIYTIGLGPSVNTNLLSKLALYTGGSYHHILTAEDLPSVFNRIENNAFYGDDTDGDGLADIIEEYGLRDGKGQTYKTLVENRFTDGDDMDDGEEAGGVIYQTVDENGEPIRYYVMLTDPTKADTDGDGVDDLDEKIMGTLSWCRDSDGDGLSDGEELAAGYNPLVKNFDNDSFGDREEYDISSTAAEIERVFDTNSVSNTSELMLKAMILSLGICDPYTYDLSLYEKGSAFVQGAVIGDFGDTLADAGVIRHELSDSVYYLAGKVAIGFIPAANVVVSIRDAVANVIKGDAIGAVLALTGLIPEAGSAVKAVGDVCSFLSHVYNAYDVTSEYAGKIEVSHIAAVPAFAFVIIRAIRFAEDVFDADFETDSLDRMVNAQIDRGTYGIVKDNIPSWEKYLSFDEGRYQPNRVSDILTDYQTVQIPLSRKATPVELVNAVRSAMNTVPGGTVTTVDGVSEYVLVRTLDLETTELQQHGTLEIAFKDAIDRTAGYFDVKLPDMKRTLKLVVTDALVSDEVVKLFDTAKTYAKDSGINLEFFVYRTTDDALYNDVVASAVKSERDEAVIILPGITGSELVAGEEYVGASGQIINEGDPVWLPVDSVELNSILGSVAIDGVGGTLKHVVECLNMLQMNSNGKPRFKLLGQTVTPDDTSVGALNTGYNMYRKLYETYDLNAPDGEKRDVIFFSYDWRSSVVNAAADLETYIANRGYSKVTLVCHSMGGIVASCYLDRSEENVAKVERIVTVGTPYGGSPKALTALQIGKFLDFTQLDSVIKSLAYNLPSVYELLPYENLIANGGEFIDNGGDELLDASATNDWLKNTASTSAESRIKLNTKLYESARATEALLYGSGTHIMNRSDVDVHIIAGYNVDTVVSVTEDGGYMTSYGVSGAGDGTVPLRSAVTTSGELFGKPVYLVDGVSHSGLFSDGDVLSLVCDIIDSEDGKVSPSGKIKAASSLTSDELDSLFDMAVSDRKVTSDPVSEAIGKLYGMIVMGSTSGGTASAMSAEGGTGLNVVRLSKAETAIAITAGADTVTDVEAESETDGGKVTENTDVAETGGDDKGNVTVSEDFNVDVRAIILLSVGAAMVLGAVISMIVIDKCAKRSVK